MRRLLVLAPLLLGACGSTPATSNGVGGATAMAAAGHGGGQTLAGTGGANSGGGAVSTAGSANSSGNGGAPATAEDAPSTPVTFNPSTAIILNPERGFYATAALVAAPDLSKLRASGVTLVHTYVRLDDFGYRLVLKSALLPTQVKPGGSFTLQIELENQGFAAPFNARPVFVVLRSAGGFVAKAPLQNVDPRRWLHGASLKARIRLPSTLAPDAYTVSLWLPDAATSLQGRADYALRFANEKTWDAATGENTLGTVELSATAPGTATSEATDFSVLPD